MRFCIRGCTAGLLAILLPQALPARAAAAYVVHDLYAIEGGDVSHWVGAPQGAAGGQVIGVKIAPTPHALVWSVLGVPQPLQDSQYVAALPNGIGGDQVVGYGFPSAQSPVAHAVLWSGPNYAADDLNPNQLGMSASTALASSGGEQVGSGMLQGALHALLWHGTAASAVDLHPGGFDSSGSSGTDGVHQVGSGAATSSTTTHALLWTGTAQSAVDLGDGAGMGAVAVGVSGNKQVGNMRIQINGQGIGTHAVLWHGSAGSMVDLHPSWADGSSSFAVATNGAEEVGYLQQGTSPLVGRAVVWSGTAASAVDLHALLPSVFTNSWANSIDGQGNIFGFASNSTDGAFHAVEWSAVPEPSSVAAVAMGMTLLLRRSRRFIGPGAEGKRQKADG